MDSTSERENLAFHVLVLSQSPSTYIMFKSPPIHHHVSAHTRQYVQCLCVCWGREQGKELVDKSHLFQFVAGLGMISPESFGDLSGSIFP